MTWLRSAIWSVLAVAIMAACPGGTRAVSVYTTRAELNAAYPGLPVEGFEAPGANCFLVSPLSAPACNILPGVVLQDVPGPEAQGLYLRTDTIAPSVFVGPNRENDDLELLFPIPTYAVGFDIWNRNTPGEPVVVQIYGDAGRLTELNLPGTTSRDTPHFVGVSHDRPITRIFVNVPDVRAFALDNLAFGPMPVPPPPPGTVIAHSNFSEPTIGQNAYVPAAGAAEMGFSTNVMPSGGASPLVAVAIASGTASSPVLTHRSANATTTFNAVDLRRWDNVHVTVQARVSDTTFESGDRLQVSVTNGADTINLVNLAADNTVDLLDDVAGDGFFSYTAAIPDRWQQATLRLATSSNSSTGAESFDFDAVEFRGQASPSPLILNPGVAPALAQDVLNVASAHALTNLNRTGERTFGILNHPGEPDGNLHVWLELLGGLEPSELNAIAADLESLPDVVSARRSAGVSFLPTANLEIVFRGGAPTGQLSSVAFSYYFGSDVVVNSIAVPEPASGGLTLLAVALLWRVCRRIRPRNLDRNSDA